MKARVIENLCIGCGACVGLVPDVFDFTDDGYAHVICEEIKEDLKEEVADAAKNCPTNAIDVD